MDQLWLAWVTVQIELRQSLVDLHSRRYSPSKRIEVTAILLMRKVFPIFRELRPEEAAGLNLMRLVSK